MLKQKQLDQVNAQLEEIDQPAVEGKIELYIASAEFESSDFTGGIGLASSILGSASIVLAISLSANVPIFLQIFGYFVAIALFFVSLSAIWKNYTTDATVRAAIAVHQERSSTRVQVQVAPKDDGQLNNRKNVFALIHFSGSSRQSN